MSLDDTRALAALALAAVALAAGATGALGGPTRSGAGPADRAAAPTRVDACTTINESGTYLLTADVENGGDTRISETCIEITADDVVLDGRNHTLDGRGVSDTTGVAVVGASNVTVRNVSVDDWHEGVLVANGTATVEGVRSFSNAYGVRLRDAAGSAVSNGTITDNLVGVSAVGGDVRLSGNRFSGNRIRIE